MTAGYAISTLSRPVMAAAGAWGEVLTARFVDRVGKGVRTAPRDAIIAESTETGRLGTAFGVYHTVAGLALLPASVIAGFLWDNIGPAAPFFYGAATSLAAAVLFIVLRVGRRSGG